MISRMTTTSGARRPNYKGERHTHMQKIPVALHARAVREAKRLRYESLNDYVNALLALDMGMAEHVPPKVKRKRKPKVVPAVEAPAVEAPSAADPPGQEAIPIAA